LSPKVGVGLQTRIDGSLHKWFRQKRKSLRSIAKKLNRDVFRKYVRSLNFDYAPDIGPSSIQIKLKAHNNQPIVGEDTDMAVMM
jgi:hypothetical protein